MNLTALSDGELVGAFAEGGANEPFAELVRRHSAMVFRTCRRVSGSHQDAEDAMQLVFAALAENASLLAGYRSLGGWLYSTAWHISRHVYRSRVARLKRESHAAQTQAIDPATQVDDDLLKEMYRALEMLPPDYRDVLVLHHLEGLTVQEVAEVIDCPPGTAASRLSRGRAMVRERMSGRGLDLYFGALEGTMLAELTRSESVPAVKIPLLPPRFVASAAASTTAFRAVVASTAGRCAVATYVTGKCAIAAYISLLTIGVGAISYGAVATAHGVDQKTFHASASASASATSTAAAKKEYKRMPASGVGSFFSGPGNNVPEPSSLALLGVAAVATCMRRRR